MLYVHSRTMSLFTRRFYLIHIMCLQIRIQAIRGFPLLGKDAEFVSKIADILGQLLACGIAFSYP
jgi:hypothetical protein